MATYAEVIYCKNCKYCLTISMEDDKNETN